jgi:hypothetical protein
MSFERFEPARAEELQSQKFTSVDSEAVGWLDSMSLDQKKEPESKKNEMTSTRLPSTVVADMKNTKLDDQKNAQELLPKDDTIWPPPTIEAAIGSTEWWKNVETKNA